MHKGQILKKLIKSSSFTQRKVADHLGVSENYLSTILKDANLKDEIVDPVCALLGINRDEHFIEDDSSNKVSYKQKYEDLQDKYMEEKEAWLTDKQASILRESELNNEVYELKRELITLREKLSKYESNTDIRKMG